MITENGFATRKGFVKNRSLETATTQIFREQKQRNEKRKSRQRKKMELIARQHGIKIENERRTTASTSLWTRFKWALIKIWRKLISVG